MPLELNGFRLVAICSLLEKAKPELLDCLPAQVCGDRQCVQAIPWESQASFCSDGTMAGDNKGRSLQAETENKEPSIFSRSFALEGQQFRKTGMDATYKSECLGSRSDTGYREGYI